MNTIIVGEIGINHSGSIELAKKLIDICFELGIHYVKFQKRDIESCYTKAFLDSPRESMWGNTQRDQKEGLEFTLEEYIEIDRYCREKGNIRWFASPWDLKSIDFLESYFPTLPYLKIPSAKITDEVFLNRCKEAKFDLIMSTGMSSLEIVKKATSLLVGNKYGYMLKYLLGCTSSYPCPTKDINLNQLKILKHYFQTPYCDIGWSDHSGGILFPALSTALGAKMIEVHITLNRSMVGSDQASSLEPEGLRHLIKYVKAIEEGLGNPVKEVQESEIPIIKKLRG